MPFCPLPRAEKFQPYLDAAMIEFHIDTGLRAAMFIAQVAHESGSLRYMQEIATGEAYENNKDLQNDLPEAKQYPPDGKAGPWFKGRGPIQITGYKNYKKYGALMSPDDPELFLREPQLLAQPKDGCRASACFFATECLEAADADNFLLVSQIVNCPPSWRGTKKLPNGWTDRVKNYDYAKRAFGV